MPSQQVDIETREADRWAKSLERLVKRAQIFTSRWNIPVFTGDLFAWVGTWYVNRHETSGAQLEGAMVSFLTQLLEMRNSYAASWEVETGRANARSLG